MGLNTLLVLGLSGEVPERYLVVLDGFEVLPTTKEWDDFKDFDRGSKLLH